MHRWKQFGRPTPKGLSCAVQQSQQPDRDKLAQAFQHRHLTALLTSDATYSSFPTDSHKETQWEHLFPSSYPIQRSEVLHFECLLNTVYSSSPAGTKNKLRRKKNNR